MRRVHSHPRSNGFGLYHPPSPSNSASLPVCRGRGSRCAVVAALSLLIFCALLGTLAVLSSPTRATYYFPAFTHIPTQEPADISTDATTLDGLPLPHTTHSSTDPPPVVLTPWFKPPPTPPATNAEPVNAEPADADPAVSPPSPPPTPITPATPATPSHTPTPSRPRTTFHELLHPLPITTSYHRCDLLDWHHEMPDPEHVWKQKPEWNYHDTGQCTSYHTDKPATEWVEEETHAYTQLGQDQAYFTIHHVRHVEEDGHDVGGHVYVLQENCYRRPQLVHSDRHAAVLVDQRFGPTALELRINGSELHTTPLRFIAPTRYSHLHLAIMKAGSHRPQVVSGPDADQTGQVKADLTWLDPPGPWPGPRDDIGHRRDAVGVRSNRTGRVYGVDVCMYEGDYAVATSGTYEVRVLLLNVDYEDISQVGHRRIIHRSQNALLYRLPPRPVYVSPRVVWPHAPHESIHPLLNAEGEPPPSRLPISADDNIHLFVDHHPSMTGRVVDIPREMPEEKGEKGEGGMRGLPPNPATGYLPIFAHPGYDGRWVNVSGTRRVEGWRVGLPMPIPVWWDGPFRRRVLREWSEMRPPFFFCAIHDPHHFDYVPYTFDQLQLPPPPPATPSLTSSPLSPPTLLQGTQPLTWSDASTCLAGRRLAFLGDSQTRTLINRLASIFSAAEVKFVKQKFARVGQTTPVESQWECVQLSASVAQGGWEERGRGNMSAAADTFELCYWPVSFLQEGELLMALTHEKDFDIVVVNSGQHHASGGWTMSQYGKSLHAAFMGLEKGLTPLVATVAPRYGEVADNRSSVAEVIHLPPGHTRLSKPATPALRWMRDKILWWNSQMYAHDMGQWPYVNMPTEHRPGRILGMYNEVSRGLMNALDIEQLDFTEAVYLTFKDCATDGSHGDWPFFDIFSARIVEAMLVKWQCTHSSSTTTGSSSST